MDMRRPGFRMFLRAAAVVLLMAGIAAPAVLAQTQSGWTQIDVTWPGNRRDSAYTGKEGTASIDIYVKCGGEFVKKTITLEIKKGKSVNQMATELSAKLRALQNEGCIFSFSQVSNGITIWPVDAGADPAKEGQPVKSPAGTDATVRKETHPLKK